MNQVQRYEYLQSNEDDLETTIDIYDVSKQTEEFCLEMVRRDGLNLKYVRNQTDDICIAAVKQNYRALEYMKILSFDAYFEVTKKNSTFAHKYYNSMVVLGIIHFNKRMEDAKKMFESDS